MLLHATARAVSETASIKTAKLERSPTGLWPGMWRPAMIVNTPNIISSPADNSHHMYFKCPQGGGPAGGRGINKELADAVVLMVSVDVTELDPFKVTPGGEKVQVVSGFCAVASVP